MLIMGREVRAQVLHPVIILVIILVIIVAAAYLRSRPRSPLGTEACLNCE